MAHQPAQSGSPVAGAVAAGQALALGNTTRMLQIGVPVEALKPQAEMLRATGASVMHLAVDGKLAGLLSVSDPIKESPPEAWSSLTASGLRIVMATGDGLTTAMAVGKRLGIDEVHGEIKPAGKLQLVEQLQREGRIVAMAGDGINDAPALAKADVGIVLYTPGSQAARCLPPGRQSGLPQRPMPESSRHARKPDRHRQRRHHQPR